jgi:hypothetical protein
VKEADVAEVFSFWLVADGWHVERDVDFVDLVADRPDGTRLYVEVLGRTASPVEDVDALYGRLLRRMRPDEPQARYAAVVAEELQPAVLRVAPEVRAALRLDLFAVTPDKQVRQL